MTGIVLDKSAGIVKGKGGVPKADSVLLRVAASLPRVALTSLDERTIRIRREACCSYGSQAGEPAHALDQLPQRFLGAALC